MIFNQECTVLLVLIVCVPVCALIATKVVEVIVSKIAQRAIQEGDITAARKLLFEFDEKAPQMMI